jgi:ribosomal 30S subunit maturation factor RimM
MSPVRSSSGSVEPAGSPQPGEPVFVAVGKLRRPHGVHGEIIMDVYTDFPERLRAGMLLYAGDAHQELSLTNRRWHQDSLLPDLLKATLRRKAWASCGTRSFTYRLLTCHHCRMGIITIIK